MMWMNPWTRRSAWNWNPWSEMQSLHAQMNRLLDANVFAVEDAAPPINVWTGEQGARVQAQLPGWAPESVHVTVVGDTLALEGKRETKGEDGRTLHRRERGSTEFARSFQLPFRVEEDEVRARFDKGILTIELPRAKSDRPRRIPVQTAA